MTISPLLVFLRPRPHNQLIDVRLLHLLQGGLEQPERQRFTARGTSPPIGEQGRSGDGAGEKSGFGMPIH
jgi:hypothetical protein